MNRKTKTLWGLMSLLPIAAFTCWTVYLMIAAGYLPPSELYENHRSISGLISQNYAGLLVALLLAFALTGAVLASIVLHLYRLQYVSKRAKVFWIVFMCCFGAFSFPVFWYSFMQHEPECLPVSQS